MLAAIALTAVGLSGCFGSDPGYAVRVEFPSAQGLFTGNAVELLGVRVGSVTSIQDTAGGVLTTMSVQNGVKLPAGVTASLVTPELLGEPSVELSPGYTGGQAMPAGGMIPESRAYVPITTNQLLKELQNYLQAIDPHAVGSLIDNLAQDLSGKSLQLNSLIHDAAGTIQLLAAKGNTLGQLMQSLAQVTGVLRSHDTELAALISSYDQVSGVIAQSEQQLGQAVTALDNMSNQLAALLTPNLGPLKQDVSVLATTGRTIDRNLSTIDAGLKYTVKLFSGAQRTNDFNHGWLPENLQLSSPTQVQTFEAMLADRLAGICRRVLVHHSAGLSEQAKATLGECGNPASGYFNPVLRLVPQILNGVIPPSDGSTGGSGAGGQPAATSAQAAGGSQAGAGGSARPAGFDSGVVGGQVVPGAAQPNTVDGVFSAGLSKIPGLAAGQRAALLLSGSRVVASGGGGSGAAGGSGSARSGGGQAALPPMPKLTFDRPGSKGFFQEVGGGFSAVFHLLGGWL